jgi:mRNA (guanine-N7-)-methyltransferase
MTPSNLPRFKKRERDPKENEKRLSSQKPRKTAKRPITSLEPRNGIYRVSRSPGADSKSRSPGRRSPGRRSPTPPPRSPPRKLKRPGGASRLTDAEKEASRQRLVEIERATQQRSRAELETRGVHEVVRQHYNAVPERGREWRKSGSKIAGLRSFNNWVKSCIIQKFSPDESFDYEGYVNGRGTIRDGGKGLLVLDIGCGKGGDLGKWQQAPQAVELYVGVDSAEVSIDQAVDRYREMREGRGRGGHNRNPRRRQDVFDAKFFAQDAYGSWLGDIPIVKSVGIDPAVGPDGNMANARWGGGGFDLVTMMFCMHYAFETESKARMMLKNVAGSLKKGGRFIGVIPNSDVLSENVKKFHKRQTEAKQKEAEEPEDGEEKEEGELEEVPEWGNDIYKVRFPGKTPEDGIFRPPFGWKYSYFLQEAVEEVPEYVVPWEAFRA